MSEEIESQTNSGEAVCPFCKAEQPESWYLQSDNGTITCDECKRDFDYSRDLKLIYTTSDPKRKATE
jgi:hypothetical protein